MRQGKIDADSPGINAGRGLKLCLPCQVALTGSDSPGINAGRGLKQRDIATNMRRSGFARY